MTPEQREALHIARYALTRVVDVHVIPVGDRLPDSLHKAVLSCLDELDEALPVGDLGEKPSPLIFGQTATVRDFPEDFKLENGNYQHICVECRQVFYGYKRRLQCKVCASRPAPTDEKALSSEQVQFVKMQVGRWLQIKESSGKSTNWPDAHHSWLLERLLLGAEPDPTTDGPRLAHEAPKDGSHP